MTTTERTTADVLKDMRELLAEPERWTQGSMEFTAPDAVADWNDAPERTHAEVLDLLDRAIKRAEAAS